MVNLKRMPFGYVAVMVMAGAVCLIVCVSAPPHQVGNTTVAVSGESAYDYAAPDAEHLTNPEEMVTQSESQWPESPADRMREMSVRLTRVTEAINEAAGTACVVMQGHTGKGVAIVGEGTLMIDATMVWRLDEDALAALIAQGVASEVLDPHAPQALPATAHGSAPKLGPEHVDRTAADELAGRLVAKSGYASEAFARLMDQEALLPGGPSRDSERYPVSRRMRAFQRGYDLEQESRKVLADRGSKAR